MASAFGVYTTRTHQTMHGRYNHDERGYRPPDGVKTAPKANTCIRFWSLSLLLSRMTSQPFALLIRILEVSGKRSRKWIAGDFWSERLPISPHVDGVLRMDMFWALESWVQSPRVQTLFTSPRSLLAHSSFDEKDFNSMLERIREWTMMCCIP